MNESINVGMFLVVALCCFLIYVLVKFIPYFTKNNTLVFSSILMIVGSMGIGFSVEAISSKTTGNSKRELLTESFNDAIFYSHSSVNGQLFKDYTEALIKIDEANPMPEIKPEEPILPLPVLSGIFAACIPTVLIGVTLFLMKLAE